ncbi:MAG: SusC/RagA family TonB-linked outer membrane protein [bacterium]
MDTTKTKSQPVTGFRSRFQKKPPIFLLILSIFIALVLMSGNALAQKAEIKGKVVDKTTGQPMIGATVAIPSIRAGAVTDKDGNFSFKAPEGKYIVRAKFIGFEDVSKEVTLKPGETETVDFELSTSGVMTDEIVVIGLSGEVDRNKLGNTIGSVSGKEVAKVISSSAIDAISGRVAGVQVTRNSGTPGAGTYITMRGRKTIMGSSEPLYVIDGIIMDNDALYDPSGTKQFGNRAIDINPLDIESMEILKGASAAAIYGSQAANGVVLITTKRGSMSPEGKPSRITYSSSVQVDQKSGSIPLQTTYGQRIPFDEATQTPGSSDSYGDKLPAGTKTYAQDEVPFRTGLSNVQSLSISGGVPQFDYLVNGTIEGIQGFVVGSNYDRASVRANLGMSLLPGVTLQTNNNYISINNDLPQDGSNPSGILLGALRTPPEFKNDKYLYDDGTQRRFAGYDNPIWTEEMNTYNSQIERFLHSTDIKWKPYYWMTLAGNFGLDNYSYANIERLAVGAANSPNRAGYINHQTIRTNQMNLDLTATASQSFFDDQLQTNLVIGSQTIWYENTNDWADAVETSPHFNQIEAGATKDGGSAYYQKKMVGLFAQLTSTLWDRLSLTLAIRRDGKSTFGESDQFHYYPKAGLSYTLSDEEFMKGTKDIFSNIRLRASYGEAGSPSLPGVYATNFLYGTGGFFDPWDRSSTANRGGYIGYRQGGLPADYYVVAGSSEIGPERTLEREIGLDLGFLDNRISLEATYFYENMYDLILDVPLAASTGFDQQLRNAGQMYNQGFELSLKATPILTEDFVWNCMFNYSTVKNEVTKLVGAEYLSLNGGFVGINNIAMEGEELGVFWGYGYLKDESGNLVYTQWDPDYDNGDGTTGAIYYMENGEKVFNDQYGMGYIGVPIHDENLQILGNPNPEFLFSFRSDLTFLKDFTFSFLIDASWGFDVWNGTRGALYNFGTHGNTEDREDNWVNDEGTQVQIVSFDDNGNAVFENADKTEKYWTYENGFLVNEAHVEDGSFIKLREVSLEYRWHGLQEWNINTIVFTFTARNLLTITDYTGFDPEVNTFSLAEGRGYDYFTLPQTMSFRFGVSIIY